MAFRHEKKKLAGSGVIGPSWSYISDGPLRRTDDGADPCPVTPTPSPVAPPLEPAVAYILPQSGTPLVRSPGL